MRSTKTSAVFLLAAVFIAVVIGTNSFEFAGYCRKMCMWGRGGNLCRCSAVHFAGKRATPQEIGENGHWPGTFTALRVQDVPENPPFAKVRGRFQGYAQQAKFLRSSDPASMLEESDRDRRKVLRGFIDRLAAGLSKGEEGGA